MLFKDTTESDFYVAYKHAVGKQEITKQETSFLGPVLEKLKESDKSLADLSKILAGADIIDLALDLHIPSALESFTTVVGRIDVGRSNACGTRRGNPQLRLPAGYRYWDHKFDEESANPRPGNVQILVVETGVDVSWEVPFIGTSIGPWCGGEKSWLHGQVTVRGYIT